MKHLLLPLLLCACALPAERDGVIIVRNDPGGDMATRERHVAHLLAAGTPMRVDGTCFSACTLYLKLERVCSTPDAKWTFHAPNYYGLPAPASVRLPAIRKIARYYPKPLGDWYVREFSDPGLGTTTGLRTISFSGAEMIERGYVEECL